MKSTDAKSNATWISPEIVSSNWNSARMQRNQIQSGISFPRRARRALDEWWLSHETYVSWWPDVSINRNDDETDEGRPTSFSSLVTQIHKNIPMSTSCSYPVMGGIVCETTEKKKPKNDKTNQRNCNANEKFLELKPVGSRASKANFSRRIFPINSKLSCPNSYT